jgi:hypothetical protein
MKISNTQYKFTVKGKSVYVLWSENGNSSIPSEISGVVKVTDYLGHEEVRHVSQIVLNESPVFVE